jgi:tripartite-type tricarboxylate transporter receptor subunit TctC
MTAPHHTVKFAAASALLGLAAALAPLQAQAQRIVRIVAPFGPGAVQDAIARTFNNELGKELGASVIVENRAGADMQHIPMKSTGDAVNEVLAGRVQGVTSSLTGLLPFKSDPRVKLLAYTGLQRSRFAPDLPTVAESGLPGFKFDSWIGLLAPAGTPKAEIDRLHAAMQRVMADPAVQERLARLGTETGNMSPDDFQKLLRADYEQAAVLVKASGARIE